MDITASSWAPSSLPSEARRPVASMPSSPTPTRPYSAGAESDISETYYLGLPSRPKLVATSQIDYRSWSGVGFQDEKELLHICGTDPIVKFWDTGISSVIMGILNETCSGSVVVDVVRIGYVMGFDTKEAPSMTTIVWIGVPTDAVTKTVGKAIVDRCKAVLDEYGLGQVQVEMRETFISSTALLNSTLQDSPRVFDLALPFTSSIGTAITTFERPFCVGTAGVYLRDRNAPTDLYLITAQHVVSEEAGVHRALTATDTEKYPDVLLYLPPSWDDHLTEAATTAFTLINLSARHDSFASQKSQSEIVREKESARTMVNGLCAQLRREWSKQADRVLGTVVCHPKVSHDKQTAFTEDWAMIKVAGDQVKEPLKNTFNLRGAYDTRIANVDPEVEPKLDLDALDENGLILPIHSFVPQSEAGVIHMPVLKRGATTGLTIGYVGPIATCLRRGGMWSRELVVTSRVKNPFSQPGDSGAAVVDRQGRFVGMIICGCGSRETAYNTLNNNDTSYITPAFWLLERITQFGIDVELA